MRTRVFINGQPIAAATQSGARKVSYRPIPETEGLLSTVYDVDVCAVGIEYPLASGPTTFTTEDLLHAVASQDDPNVHPPRVWLGHTDDDRFHAGRATPAGSAEPALGKIVNMRVEDDGMTLVGDITGCPTWLAKILASAYPSRSIEGFKGAVTASGREWRMVITDMALLGVTWPGVSSLEDLRALYSEEGPEVEITEEEMMPIAAARVRAQVDVDDVRRAFGKSFEAGEFKELEWPWIRAILQDPNELIIDDDATGEIHRLPYSSNDKREVTFGELKQVKIEYVNASHKQDPQFKTDVIKVTAELGGRPVAASYQTRDESLANLDQEVHMDPAKLRASLGLPADATDDQVRAKLTELQAALEPSPDQVPAVPESPFKGPGSPPEADPPKEAPTKADPEERPIGDPARITTPEQVAAALKAAGLVAVPSDQWTGLQANVAQLTQVREAEQARQDLSLVAQAVIDRKIFPHQRPYYEAKIADPVTRDTFRHLLTASVDSGGLMAGIVPAHQLSTDDGQLTANTEAYPASWFPEVQQAKSDGPITLEG